MKEVNLDIRQRVLMSTDITDFQRKVYLELLKVPRGALIAYVTSQAKDGLVRLSPFYPHGDIPVIIAIF